MATDADYRGNVLEYTDDTDSEKVTSMAPIHFEDDFLGYQLLLSEAGSRGIWTTVEVNLNTAIAQVADQAGGVVQLTIDADNNAEDAVLYWGDQRGVSLKHAAWFEARVKVAVLPTLTTTVVVGMAGDHNLDKDTITEGAWFRLQNSSALLCESDDTTNNNDDVDASTTVSTSSWYTLAIDFSTITDVLFYVDGNRVASTTTFDMSNLTDAEAVMQPYISLDKDADTGVGTLYVDYVRVFANRS